MMQASTSGDTDRSTQLADRLRRANPSAKVNPAALQERLLDLFHATGLLDDGSDAARWWNEFTADGPSHKTLAKQFNAIAESEDPLALALRPSTLLSELDALGRNRWSRRFGTGEYRSLKRRTTAELSPRELDHLRAMARHLAMFHRSKVRRGRPTKDIQFTVINELAFIFAEFAELTCDVYELPHSRGSNFIQFARLAMAPYFARTEVSQSALLKYWKGMKDRSRA